MPPRLSDYGVTDWLHARPLTQALKTRRYRRTDRNFSASPARVAPPAWLLPALKDKRVLVTIAFNDPQTVTWQAQLIKLYADDVIHVIADNTRDDDRAALIAEAAAAHGLAYIRLPANPTNVPSRSHGLALNWMWRNVIRPGAPSVFGFLDDDIYPTAPSDPFAALATQDWFGVVRPEGPIGKSTVGLGITRWFLWAGFAMYRFGGVRDKPLDFSQDWFLRLDTGGANWDVLYRHVARESLREQDTRFVPYRPGLTMEEAPFQWCDTWLHEVGVMGRPEFAQDKRRTVGEILAPHLEKARARFPESSTQTQSSS